MVGFNSNCVGVLTNTTFPQVCGDPRRNELYKELTTFVLQGRNLQEKSPFSSFLSTGLMWELEISSVTRVGKNGRNSQLHEAGGPICTQVGKVLYLGTPT